MGVVAKKKGFLIYKEMRKYLVINEEALQLHSRLDFLIYEENFVSFLSVQSVSIYYFNSNKRHSCSSLLGVMRQGEKKVKARTTEKRESKM
jgi:hypothetical protein